MYSDGGLLEGNGRTKLGIKAAEKPLTQLRKTSPTALQLAEEKAATNATIQPAFRPGPAATKTPKRGRELLEEEETAREGRK